MKRDKSLRSAFELKSKRKRPSGKSRNRYIGEGENNLKALDVDNWKDIKQDCRYLKLLESRYSI